MKKMNMITGKKAIDLAKQGARLYMLNPQYGWLEVESHEGTILRAERMEESDLWVYGVRA